MAKTWTLTQIRESINEEKEVIIAEDELVSVMEKEEPHRLKMLFKKAGNRYVPIEITFIIEKIVNKLAPHVDVKRFLKELLVLYSAPEEILELSERLEKGYVKVSEAKRCYSIMIGGKPGRPYEFNLVG